MRITDREIFTEENQGQVLIQTGGTTRLAIDGAGAATSLSATNASLTTPTESAPTVTSITATSASLKGTILIGGASDVVGLFGATPVAVQATTATTGAFAASTGTAALSGSTWVGNTGSKTYSVGDIVSALKKYGLLSA